MTPLLAITGLGEIEPSFEGPPSSLRSPSASRALASSRSVRGR
jgi:hypothetical protein